MDLTALINLAVKISDIFLGMFSNPFLEKIKSLLIAIQNSPAFIQWLSDLIAKEPTPVPAGALAEFDPNTPGFAEAVKASPELVQALKQQEVPESVPGKPKKSEQFGISGIFTLISYLPTIIALLKALRDGTAGTVK